MKYPLTDKEWFVVGFAFAQESGEVLLIEKQKSWCRGLWNGVGGSIEEIDSKHPPFTIAHYAMAREFEEETSLRTEAGQWERFAMLNEPHAVVEFFRMFIDRKFLSYARKTTDENVLLLHKNYASTHVNLMPNLAWLIPMAWQRNLVFAAVQENDTAFKGVKD